MAVLQGMVILGMPPYVGPYVGRPTWISPTAGHVRAQEPTVVAQGDQKEVSGWSAAWQAVPAGKGFRLAEAAFLSTSPLPKELSGVCTSGGSNT